MNDSLLSNGELKDSYFARPITKNDDYIPYEVVEKYNKELARYKNTLEEIKNITDKLITELPEYHSCYYKDECGDNCTPKKQSKVEYCFYENVDKILTIINEVLNDRD